MIHSMRRMWFYSTADSRSNKRDKEDTSINNMPHTLSLPDQVKLADLLELEDVNIIQIEGGKCSNPTKYGVLGLIEKSIVLADTEKNGWSLLGNDRISQQIFGVLCAKASMLLQLCSEVDENAIGACAQLVFAPIDESFDNDALLLPSGFRVIPLDPKTNTPIITRTLDLASKLEVGSGNIRATGEADDYNLRSVLTIAFQFTCENHLRDNGFAYLPGGICASSMNRPMSYDQAIA
ncbi:Homeobox-leucine zipper protein [Arachis hypogaea]|nr:Homeobox-leucine zipper protein [Arachis hypogaea]